MIQPTSPVRAAATAAETAQPAVARSIGGRSALDGVRGFSERMSVAAGDTVAPPAQWPAQVSPQARADAATHPVALPSGNESAETAELGLLEIIEQQLAEIDAREAEQAEAVLTLPQSPADEIDNAGERLGWSSSPLPSLPGTQATTEQAELLEAMWNSDWQAGTRAPESVVGSGTAFAEPRSTSRALDLPASPVQHQQPLPAVAMQAPMAQDSRSRLSVESLLAAAEPLEAGDPLLSAERAQAPAPQVLDRTLKLQAPEAKWGEQMLHSLRENVELQVQQKIQSATIRLDPPELGSMEILLSHESGRLHVQLTAANADVARLLQQSSERLRQELVGQHFVQVNVQVGADGGGQQGQQRQRAALAAEELPLAARTPEQEQQDSQAAERARDVLITV